MLGFIWSDLLALSVYYSLGSIAICWFAGVLTQNWSQVDKLWSINPIVYAWFAAVFSNFNERVMLLTILVTIWGIRLSYNFTRRGGYDGVFQCKPWTGEEDYRWETVKGWFDGQPLKRELFHAGFVCIYQLFFIIFYFTTPVIFCADHETGIDTSDYIIFGAGLLIVLIETVADQQSWNFQSEKYRMINANEDRTGTEYEHGFVYTGLWAYSRHPNYFMEMSFWVNLYLFTVRIQPFNWTFGGIFLLIFSIFIPSVDFSEGITLSKYPSYATYQNQVGKFFPIFGRFDPSSLTAKSKAS